MKNNTGIAVTAVGAAVTGLGYSLIRKNSKSRFGSGLLGFGLANLAIGILDLGREKIDHIPLPFDME